MVDNKFIFLVIYAVVVVLLVLLFLRLPTGFLPNEDQGSVQVQFRLPAGATQTRTMAVQKTVEKLFPDCRRSANVTRDLHRQRSDRASRARHQNVRARLHRPSNALGPDRKGSDNTADGHHPARRPRVSAGSSATPSSSLWNRRAGARPGASPAVSLLELLNSGGLSRQQFKTEMQQLLADGKATIRC